MNVPLVNPDTIVYSTIGGFLPALLWLIFWLKEDEAPEPKRLLLVAFFGGVIAIPTALVLELLWNGALKTWATSPAGSLALIAGFAFIEEYTKYFFCYSLIFWRKEYDEPADAIIYMITTALGFAALENTLYLITPFHSALIHGVATSDLRFLGPTLLHALSSGFLGYFIAQAFWRSHFRKEIALGIGLFFSTALHTLFNIFILQTGGTTIEPALVLLVIAGLGILFSFERIKHKIINTSSYAQR